MRAAARAGQRDDKPASASELSRDLEETYELEQDVEDDDTGEGRREGDED